jgi:ribosomal protein S18 acetylase RimI-like enzyme
MHPETLSLAIRPVDLERDGARMIAYARDLFAISFGGTRFTDQFGEDGAAYIPWVAEKQTLARENAGLALLEGEPAGMVLLGPWPDDPAVGYVHHYYLEPHARGRGLGSELDAYAVRALRRQGHCTARLSVAQTNARAIRAYRKQGWNHAGPRLDQPGILYMHRFLNPSRPAVPSH